MDINAPFNAPMAGEAGSAFGDTYKQVNLLLGTVPPHGAPKSVKYAAGSAFKIYSVVGVDATGNLALAKQDGSVAVMGILTANIDASMAEGSVDVLTSGHYNIDALTWGADYTTDAQKLDAVKAPSTLLFGINPSNRL